MRFIFIHSCIRYLNLAWHHIIPSVVNWITLRFFGGWNPKKSVSWLWEASSMMRCGMWLTQDRSTSHKTLGRKSRRKRDDKLPHSWDYLSCYQATMKDTDEKNPANIFNKRILEQISTLVEDKYERVWIMTANFISSYSFLVTQTLNGCKPTFDFIVGKL